MAGLRVLDDFEGASIGAHSVDGGSIFARLREEPLVRKDGVVHDYNWHFVFGIKNDSEKTQEAEIFINNDEKAKLGFKAELFWQKDPNFDFHPLTTDSFTDSFRKYHLKISVPSRETVYLSNTYFRSLRLLNYIYKNLSDSRKCNRIIYGTSVEGRELTAYVYGCEKPSDSDKPSFLITSGFHPMEADTFATEAIMEHMASKDTTDMLRYFNFVIIPMVNPDGFYHGYNGCNAKGINLYWDFRHKDADNAPEAYYLWKYANEIRPCVYIDFHSYTFQLHRKKAAPYLKPIFFYAGSRVRAVVDSISKKLNLLHNETGPSGESTYMPSTLSYKLTDKFNTITYAKYHLHIAEGKEKNKADALNIVEIISGLLIKHGLLTKKDILLFPHGNVMRGPITGLAIKLKMLWKFGIKKFLRQVVYGWLHEKV